MKEGEEEEEPETREMLPYLNDPKVKISVWSILKDCIGKDFTKIPFPVYFNDPTSLLQRIGGTMEYSYILDRAATDPDPVRRLALIAIY